MVLYHGTIGKYAKDIAQNGILLSKSKRYLDFGPGFYLTPEYPFALKTAIHRANSYNKFNKGHHESPAILKFDLDEAMLNILNTKQFTYSNSEWYKYVIHNRCKREFLDGNHITTHNQDQRYDLSIGPTADGEIALVAKEYQEGKCCIDLQTMRRFGASMGTQYVLHTKKSLSCITLIEYVILDIERS